MPYVIRPKGYWEDEPTDNEGMPKSLTVHESEADKTGLLDQHGNEIWRVREPVGFRGK